ncbi:MAG: outer membrane beta-barrel protein, partial [Bacteroidota bacterium]|nr:outer membrane beta-barrel protein [Bacteroidota bacterium]MDX5431430.1 outer membrane beta-barrel protein [Bacteroidota bacterium]MDX5470158.1 outer membrane beta-barrel protein [Bacteroidota bacterium]
LSFLLVLMLAGNAQKESNFGLGIGSVSNFYPLKHKDKIYNGTGIGSGIRLEYNQKEKDLSTGSIHLGGIAVFGQSSSNYQFNNWKSKYIWRHMVLAARLKYVYPVDKELDLYGGIHLGLHIEQFSELYSTEPPAGYAVSGYTHGTPYSGLFFGADYKVAKKMSLFGELGYDLMWFTIGAKLYL